MSNIFHPTEEEFKDFVKYIEHIEKQNVHIASGICKLFQKHIIWDLIWVIIALKL
uniref:JmjN domain-containing protein n=1 Tax=Meloidogyne enterolobii TaxID=390850 RepID=A0A6V7Y301_MELEN|nr:unnamed protein product [Meloidogyne enterolobii]